MYDNISLYNKNKDDKQKFVLHKSLLGRNGTSKNKWIILIKIKIIMNFRGFLQLQNLGEKVCPQGNRL